MPQDNCPTPFDLRNMEATKINGHLINIGRLAGMSGVFDYDLHA